MIIDLHTSSKVTDTVDRGSVDGTINNGTQLELACFQWICNTDVCDQLSL